MNKTTIEFELIVISRLQAVIGEHENAYIEEASLTRQLAKLDGKSRDNLMVGLVEESNDNQRGIKTFDTFSKIFNANKDSITSVLSTYPPAPVA